MEKNNLRIGLVNWLILLAAAAVTLVAARYVKSASGLVAGVLLAAGFLVALVGYFQMRLEERERLEKLEFDELNRQKGSTNLFGTDEADTFAARQSREMFEKYFVRGFAILLCGGAGFLTWWLWNYLGKEALDVVEDRSTIAMTVTGLFGLILFLLGKYTAGLARLDDQRLLRPCGSYMLLGAYASFLVTGALALNLIGYPRYDLDLARVFLVLLGLVAAETLLTLVAEIYRPRVKGKVARILYDSRLMGIVGEPESLFRTAGQALDYQFGFKVSETWFYQTVREKIGQWAAIWVVVLLASTSVVFIEPGEQAVLERFGARTGGLLEPGAHLKLPWPVDEVFRFKTREVQTLNVGFVPKDDDHGNTILWNVAHYKEEFNLLVASREAGTTNSSGGVSVPVSLLTVSIPVQYQIRDVDKFAYAYANSGGMLEKIATREVIRYLVGVDLNEVMSIGREAAAKDLRLSIQKRSDDLGLGVEILFVGLQDIHPPTKVAEAYQSVIGAQQAVAGAILAAKGYATRTVLLASAEAQKKINEAEAFSAQRIASAAATASRFTNQIQAFNAAPSVYPTRAYLQTFARAVGPARKYIIATTNSNEVVQFNLEDKIRTDIGDVYIPPTRDEQRQERMKQQPQAPK